MEADAGPEYTEDIASMTDVLAAEIEPRDRVWWWLVLGLLAAELIVYAYANGLLATMWEGFVLRRWWSSWWTKLRRKRVQERAKASLEQAFSNLGGDA